MIIAYACAVPARTLTTARTTFGGGAATTRPFTAHAWCARESLVLVVRVAGLDWLARLDRRDDFHHRSDSQRRIKQNGSSNLIPAGQDSKFPKLAIFSWIANSKSSAFSKNSYHNYLPLATV